MKVYALIFLSFALGLRASAEQCGQQVNGEVCPDGLCCSQYGWCGSTIPYCGPGCQSQCRLGSSAPPPAPAGRQDVGKLISVGVFDQMLKHRDDSQCSSKGFYSYNAFLAAARSFPGFGTTGNETTCKRELAAFLAQTSHETSGGWESALDGPYTWGYCFVREKNQDTYCSPNKKWPCSPGQKYYGRGPIQLTYNYNYGQAGKALKLDLLKNPDLVATNATIAFETAIWFWMTSQGNKPSSHDVIIGKWRPSKCDKTARRFPGYGVITNIINGKLECGHGPDKRVDDRIGFYKRYCDILDVSYGDNLDCNTQQSFA